MTSVGLRDLREHFSKHFDRVKAGETIVVTEGGREIARIVPSPTDDLRAQLLALVEEGFGEWGGGKPQPREPLTIKGKPLSETVEELRQERDDALSGYERADEGVRNGGGDREGSPGDR